MTIAVLVILVTAPVGAIAIAVSGPKFLKRERKSMIVNEAEIEDAANNGRKIFPMLNCLQR